MFDGVAPSYDFLNRLLSLGMDRFWRRNLVRRIEEPPVLDLACGSGDVLYELTRNDRGRGALGLDFSRAMLDRAHKKLEPIDPSIGLVQGDALQLPVKNRVYGGVTCAFGVRNFQNRPEAFREVHRVLQSGGNIVILEFFPPDDSFWGRPIRWYLGSVLPAFGRYFSDSGEAYDYLQRSIEGFVPADVLRQELSEAGFIRISEENQFFGLVKIITAQKG
jgi:demethylmenaquinone methyltransferase/2-methoxy-6-polyprenyl-1,4-benzoquinol methylase